MYVYIYVYIHICVFFINAVGCWKHIEEQGGSRGKRLGLLRERRNSVKVQGNGMIHRGHHTCKGTHESCHVFQQSSCWDTAEDLR